MTAAGTTRPPVPEPPSTAALHRLVDSELALPPRLAYVALLLAASMMTAIVAALWGTEIGLPLRTRIAFGVMVTIGVSWISFAVWALQHRRPLFASHAIVAGRIAVTSTTLFVLGALAVAGTAGGIAPLAAAASGVPMVGAAAWLLRRAHRTSARLIERRATLERERSRPAH
jgi:hypothetical protein